MSGFTKWLARLYPRVWRERYGEEFIALLEERGTSVIDALSVALGALDAHMRPQVSDGRTFVVVAKIRNCVLMVLWAWVGVVVAGVGFQKMAEYDDFVEAARRSAVVGLAFDAVVVGAAVALAAVLAGGLPVAFAAVRKAFAEGRKDVPLLFCVPPLSLVGFVGYTLILVEVIYPTLGRIAVRDPVNVALFLSLVGAFLLPALASAGAVTAGVRHSEVGERALRFALYPAAVAAMAMLMVLAGTVVWGLALRAQAPALFAGDNGILAASSIATWLAIVAVMAVSTALAVAAAVRGLRARRPEHSVERSPS